MPRTQNRHVTGNLIDQPRMCEQNHKRRPGTSRSSFASDTGPRSARPFHDLGSAYTRSGVCLRCPVSENVPRALLRSWQYIPRRNRVRSPCIIIHDRDAERGADLRPRRPRTRCTARSATHPRTSGARKHGVIQIARVTPGRCPGVHSRPVTRQRVLRSIRIDVLWLAHHAGQSVGYSNMSQPEFTADTAATPSGAAAVRRP